MAAQTAAGLAPQTGDAALTVATRIFNGTTPFKRAANTPLDSAQLKVADSAMHAYRETVWERALLAEMSIDMSQKDKRLVGNSSDNEAVFLAGLKAAKDLTDRTMLTRYVREFFWDVKLLDDGFEKGDVTVVFQKTVAGEHSLAFSWALFMFLRHGAYGCVDNECANATRQASEQYRARALAYALHLAALVVKWKPLAGPADGGQDSAVETNLWDSLNKGVTSAAERKSLHDNAYGAQDRYRSVLQQQVLGEDTKSKLAQASLSASAMWSSFMVARLEKFSMLSFLIVVNICFFLLLHKRRASLRKHRVPITGILTVTIAIVTVRAFLGLVRRTEHWTEETGRKDTLMATVNDQGLRDQIYTTQALLDDIHLDVSNRKDAFDRKRAAMEHTYASFRFSERHSNRHVGLIQLLTILSFVIMIVVVLQKSAPKMDNLLLMYAPVIVLGVLVATVMQRTDQARMRTNWDKIYFQRPE